MPKVWLRKNPKAVQWSKMPFTLYFTIWSFRWSGQWMCRITAPGLLESNLDQKLFPHPKNDRTKDKIVTIYSAHFCDNSSKSSGKLNWKFLNALKSRTTLKRIRKIVIKGKQKAGAESQGKSKQAARRPDLATRPRRISFILFQNYLRFQMIHYQILNINV